MTDPALVGLAIADPPERWAALGFEVCDGQIQAGPVTLTLGIAPQGAGIAGWTLAGREDSGDVGGLPTRWVRSEPARDRPSPAAGHADRWVDHVVVITPRFDALATELDRRGFPLRRIARVRDTRMGFRRLGGPILEVVEAHEAPATGFWGITFAPSSTETLDELSARSRLVGELRPAVQPGRRIATVTREAGLSTQLAFIDPEPR